MDRVGMTLKCFSAVMLLMLACSLIRGENASKVMSKCLGQKTEPGVALVPDVNASSSGKIDATVRSPVKIDEPKVTLTLDADISGEGPAEITVFSPEGETYTQKCNLPTKLKHNFVVSKTGTIFTMKVLELDTKKVTTKTVKVAVGGG